MRQCILTREFFKSTQKHIAWLPDEFAVEGKMVDVLWNKKWDNVWVVETVYKQRLTYEEVRESVVNQRDYGASIKP